MVGERSLVLPGEQELLAAVLERAAWPRFPGDNVCQKHLAILLLTLVANDPSLYLHSHRVRLLTHHLTCVLHLPQDQATAIELAALVHDIGKLAIPTSVLQKASHLTHEEFMHIKRHPAYGAELLRQMRMPSQVTHVVSHHHEHWDGGGYPAGLQGEAIPLGARIVAIADAFEVMTSHRPYQAPRPPIQALEELRRCAGIQFDPVLVDRFCSSLETDLPGSPPVETGRGAGTNGTGVLAIVTRKDDAASSILRTEKHCCRHASCLACSSMADEHPAFLSPLLKHGQLAGPFWALPPHMAPSRLASHPPRGRGPACEGSRGLTCADTGRTARQSCQPSHAARERP